MTTLRNSFHRTVARTRYTDRELSMVLCTEPGQRTATEKSLVSRLRNKLCGITDCNCGDELGRRD